MIRVSQIKVGVDIPKEQHLEIIRKKAAKKLRLDVEAISDMSIFRRSIDARKNRDICFVYSVDINLSDEDRIHTKDPDISKISVRRYSFPYSCATEITQDRRPVIIGLGPAGLFCAYMLAKAGFRPIVFERGKCIEDRTKDVENFWEGDELDTSSNVQFGEGGAGAFSDGKLNTLIKDKNGVNKEVLRIFVDHGADEEVLYDNKPHIGTDRLKEVVKNIRESILSYGGEIHYQTCIDRFEYDDNGIKAVYAGDREFKAYNVVLAIGHSARDTFKILKDGQIPMEPKAFAVGFRVMHPQHIIDKNQYGEACDLYELPVASYKLTYQSKERGVYSFCMCPGGYVVNASSEQLMTAVNGMSYHDRGSGVANSAVVVQVNPDDYDGDDVLCGLKFQRELEKRAYECGGGKIPVQRYGDFKKSVTGKDDTTRKLSIEPECKGGYEYCELNGIMPQALNECFIEGMEDFGHKIKDFNDGNTIMAGIESRTSSPVRIIRDSKGMSKIAGLFPCGEGAGYAGGITSAAMDGIYIAERIAARIMGE